LLVSVESGRRASREEVIALTGGGEALEAEAIADPRERKRG
jgi:hypothetical protein